MSPDGIDPQEVVYGDTYRPKKGAQPTLRDLVADIIESTGVEDSNHMWHRDSSLHYADAILQLISSRLPEKKYILHLTGNEFREAHGFNKCLSEVKALLEGKE